MARRHTLGAWIVVSSLLPIGWAGCGGDEFVTGEAAVGGAGQTDASADSPSQGGKAGTSAGGGAGEGGAATGGGAGEGGAATGGGAGEGGAATGGGAGEAGAATGGAAGEAGAATGGAAGTGGSSTGGAAGAGGSSTGGAAGTGGSSTGGAAGAGGSSTGGAAGTGGSSTGGAAGTGGSSTGGAAGTGGSAGMAGSAGSGGGATCSAAETCAAAPAGGWGSFQLVAWAVANTTQACSTTLEQRHAPTQLPPPPKCQCTCGEAKSECAAAFNCSSGNGVPCQNGSIAPFAVTSTCAEISVDGTAGYCGIGQVHSITTCDRGVKENYSNVPFGMGECLGTATGSCSGGGRCAAQKPGGAYGPCIRLNGATISTCPSPYTIRVDTYKSASDKRTCGAGNDATGCTCNTMTGNCMSNANPAGALLEQGGCTSSFGDNFLVPGWQCQQLWSGGTAAVFGATLQGFTPANSSQCTLQGAPTVVGIIDWQDPETLCCKP